MQSNHPFKRISANLDVLRFPTGCTDPARSRCLNCDLQLVLHQPDLDSPDRLLGVCESCKHWYLIDVLADMVGGFMIRLPDVEVIRDLSREDPRENPSAGISLMGKSPGLPEERKTESQQERAEG